MYTCPLTPSAVQGSGADRLTSLSCDVQLDVCFGTTSLSKIKQCKQKVKVGYKAPHQYNGGRAVRRRA